MIDKLNDLIKKFKAKAKSLKEEHELENLKKEFTGKDAELNTILKSMRTADDKTRKEAGGLANKIKIDINETINQMQEKFDEAKLKQQLKKEKIDITSTGINLALGTKHPLNLVIDEISSIFTELGFDLVDGTEYETDDFCFQKLNLPIGHPARDMQDTFYINEKNVLRTHCTNMTARLLTELSKKKAEDQNISAISFGNVYRRDDDDATHSHQFMQIDGFALTDKISFANLKWVLEYMCKRLFSENTNIRMRPSYFPFTEPSVEVDITCVMCSGAGCKICKNTGFIEILGSGLINPKVLELNGIDPSKKSGLAFGIGIERIAMLKYNISNIRDFYENDLRFLKQFKYYGN